MEESGRTFINNNRLFFEVQRMMRAATKKVEEDGQDAL
jgi:hypothetical protein